MTKWQDVAQRYEGQAEVAGAGSNPVILGFIQAHGRPDATDDSAIAWCGFFMAAVFTEAGLAAVVPKEPGAAKSWRSVGERRPALCRRSAASATATTTRSPRPSTGSTRPR